MEEKGNKMWFHGNLLGMGLLEFVELVSVKLHTFSSATGFASENCVSTRQFNLLNHNGPSCVRIIDNSRLNAAHTGEAIGTRWF